MNNRLDKNQISERIYKVFSWVLVLILAFLFTFPLYWIITGSFKTPAAINAASRSVSARVVFISYSSESIAQQNRQSNAVRCVLIYLLNYELIITYFAQNI